MATLTQCDVCGDIIPLTINFHEMSIDQRRLDVCPKCAEALRLWMLSQFRGSSPTPPPQED